jgi:hypothetical protein
MPPPGDARIRHPFMSQGRRLPIPLQNLTPIAHPLQRERRNQRRRIAVQQRVPRSETEQRRPIGQDQHACPRLCAHRGDRNGYGRATLEGERKRRERQRWHEARPDDQRKHVGGVRAGAALGDDVADGPREPRHDHQQETGKRAGEPGREFMDGQQCDAGEGHRRADQVVPLQAIALQRDGQPDREKHLQLDYQRGKSCRHPELYPEEQQAELEHADSEAVTDHVPPRHCRSLVDKHHRYRGQKEPQRRQRERRHLDQRHLDRDERVAPHRDDREREEEVARREVGFQREAKPRRRATSRRILSAAA